MTSETVLRVNLAPGDIVVTLTTQAEGKIRVTADGDEILLRVHRWYVSSWERVIHAVMKPLDGVHTELRIIDPGVPLKWMELIGIAFFGVWGCVWIFGALPSSTVPRADQVLGSVVALTVMISSIALSAFGRFLSRNDGAIVSAQVQKALGAFIVH